MPKVSVIMPTYNRPDLLKKAIGSVLNQTYQDFELIVVDDCPEKPAEDIIRAFNNEKIVYIKQDRNRGGAAARNLGIKNAKGEFIAFLDDDDEWLPEKLQVQMEKFEKTSKDIGFCFSAVKNIYDNQERISFVPDGIADYHKLAMRRLKGFLTVTLIIKKQVFGEIGYFDENFPSHQEPDLMIRVTSKYKGLGINKPLVLVNMKAHNQIGASLKRRIAGRDMILKKHYDEFKKYPKILAKHYFQLGIFYRDDGQYKIAREFFKKAFKNNFRLSYLAHYLTISFDAGIYKVLKK